MIIETITVNRVTREMTALMKAYNIQILTVEYDDFEEVMIVSYRVNRIFEVNQFRKLAELTEDFVK